ncbi:MAG TPA: DMT family transporter, partial [Candidatus Dormibacteraeota bacterium]|nr:DMT family transporter [Candidatus Dormibacteraeota bacterium]
GNILATLCAISWAFTLMGLRWMGRGQGITGSPAAAVVIGNLLAFSLALPFALPVHAARPLDWAIVTGLGVIQIGVAYVFLTAGMRHVRAFEASILLLLEPVLNPVWSWLIHGERPRAWSLVGGAIILTGTLLKTWVDSRGNGAKRS